MSVDCKCFGKTVFKFVLRWGFLLATPDFDRIGPSLEQFAAHITLRDGGGPVDRVWGFIDGTHLKICKPTVGQRVCYTRYKRAHTAVLQGVTTPDGNVIMCQLLPLKLSWLQRLYSAPGIIVQMFGPVEGSCPDSNVLRDSGLLPTVRAYMTARYGADVAQWLYMYADKGYPLVDVLQTPYRRVAAAPPFAGAVNAAMAAKRVSVEHSFRKYKALWAFNNFYSDLKVRKSPVGKYFLVSALLTNVHTCLYSGQVGQAYRLHPPTLHNYLNSIHDGELNIDGWEAYVAPARVEYIPEWTGFDDPDDMIYTLHDQVLAL